MTTLHARSWIESYTVQSPSGKAIPVVHLSSSKAKASILRRKRFARQLYFFWDLTPDMLPLPLLLRTKGRMVWDSSMYGEKFTTTCLSKVKR